MSTTGMLQRCWAHDYCAPCFYLITVVTEPRRECLGVLTTGDGIEPVVKLSPPGEVVREVWRRTSAVYAGVEACECVVMPDHFHGILWVKERLARPVGHVIKAFKRVSEGECRSRGLLLPPDPGRRGLLLPPDRRSVPAAASAAGSLTLWQTGFQDSILLRRGQLKAMARYIADNPRRLAVKRANPALFTVAANLEIVPGRTCPAIGNRFLLERPLKRQVQVSRRISPDALAAEQTALLDAADHGAVLVSPCISPGEKAIARAALAAGRPLIVLLANGFAPLYKPTGRYFDACAAGRLLMIAPFPYCRQRQPITRTQCLELNALAERIASCA
jgi:REP element-mobilizing transposase RayT